MYKCIRVVEISVYYVKFILEKKGKIILDIITILKSIFLKTLLSKYFM